MPTRRTLLKITAAATLSALAPPSLPHRNAAAQHPISIQTEANP